MGILSSIGSWAGNAISSFLGSSFSSGTGGRDHDYGGSYSSSSSSTVTNYDPDKVEVAKLENERVELVKSAQLELIEVNARLEAVMIEARCKGFQAMQGSMMQMLKEVNHLAEERLVLLENGSQEQIQKVETMYADLSKDMENDDFMFSKVPQMLEIANKFPEESDSRKLYMSGIDREMAKHFDFKTEQLKRLNERCHVVVASVVESKKQMQTHIDTVISKRIEHIEQVMQVNAQLPYSVTAQISGGDQLQIEQKS
ncbi:hypothetical protein EXE10_03830 [Acinetobacter sp. WCHAc060033]|uniref:hypothetical protein n=1 Tax=Acinetobacter sp. WCHAc060033 TaxID=2518624 RepID=UPI0010234F4A|nr:hypothetical protein [Acinetobacter sp. WCHAc060033]RZG87998.1 hypothetical protein EXE10_03830 [Acinetobacter sp. WCHAc060033]